MAKRTYPPAFRQQLIELARAGRSPESLAKEFEPSAQTIRNWVVQAARDGGQRTDGLTTAERDELTRLRRELRQVKLEREILSQAAAWCARETGTIPGGSPGSCGITRPCFRWRRCVASAGSPRVASTPGAAVRSHRGRGAMPRS